MAGQTGQAIYMQIKPNFKSYKSSNPKPDSNIQNNFIFILRVLSLSSVPAS